MKIREAMALVIFARVAQEGSFSAAARALDMSVSAVSERVSGLEDRLGVRLLHRSTRHLKLTVEGRELYERCSRMVAVGADALEAATTVGDEPRGTLRITAPSLFSQMHLGEPLAAFMQAYPSVQVELLVTDGIVDLVDKGFDLAIRMAVQAPPGGLRAQLLAQDQRFLCATPDYLARYGTPTCPTELARHNCMRLAMLDASAGTSQTPESSVSPPVNGRYLVNETAMVHKAVLQGLGMAMLAGSVVEQDLAEGRLIKVLPEYTRTPLNVYAVYSPGRRTPAKVRVFIELLACHLRGCSWNLQGR
jgi:DNA-binding transcriptional LysR family regulator